MNPNEILAKMTPRQKADAVVADIAAGGFITQRELEVFKEKKGLQADLVKQIRQMFVPSQDFETPLIRFPQAAGDFVIRPVEGRDHQALGVDERVAPEFSSMRFRTHPFAFQSSIPNRMLRVNVEKEKLIETIRGILYNTVWRDLETVSIGGDTTSSNIVLATLNGFIAQATAHVVPAAGTTLSLDLLDDAKLDLPAEYRAKDFEFMTTYVSRNNVMKQLRSRATWVGDLAVTRPDIHKENGATPALPAGWPEANYIIDTVGYPLVDYNLWRTGDGGSSDRTTCVFTTKDNMAIGILWEISIEVGRDPRDRNVFITGELEFDAKFEVNDAVVLIDDILDT
jgi:hypothetical protein